MISDASTYEAVVLEVVDVDSGTLQQPCCPDPNMGELTPLLRKQPPSSVYTKPRQSSFGKSLQSCAHSSRLSAPKPSTNSCPGNSVSAQQLYVELLTVIVFIGLAPFVQ